MKKKNLSKETITKMREVIAAVLAEPKFYDQNFYPHPCKTSCCAAGYAVRINDPKSYEAKVKDTKFNWRVAAEDVLGLNTDGGYKLFLFASDWPIQFARDYSDANSALGRAQAMAARWEHFIKTDGKD